MQTIDLVKSVAVPKSSRVQQLGAMFDVPVPEESTVEWHGQVPIDEKAWNIGVIVGPSGSGKSSIARELFGDHVDVPLEWTGVPVVDDFASDQTLADIAQTCTSVGFNTVPNWMRPFHVLSTGEQFRVNLARRLLELPNPIVVDEFTSVVDRQVAQVGSHAVQKTVRRRQQRFVAVTCHYDVLPWLQPDWVLEPATMKFAWTSGRWERRPELSIRISRVGYEAWEAFAPFHYLTKRLHRGARCFVLFVGDDPPRPAAFAGMLHFPHFKARDIQRCSRLVTLPDWQGLGLAFVLIDKLAAAYKAVGKRVHCYPAHPTFVRSYDRSPHWKLEKEPGKMSKRSHGGSLRGRPCAVFSWCGDTMDKQEAQLLLQH